MIDWPRVAELRDEIGVTEFDEVVPLFLQEVEATIADLPLLLHSLDCHQLRGRLARNGVCHHPCITLHTVRSFPPCDYAHGSIEMGVRPN